MDHSTSVGNLGVGIRLKSSRIFIILLAVFSYIFPKNSSKIIQFNWQLEIVIYCMYLCTFSIILLLIHS